MVIENIEFNDLFDTTVLPGSVIEGVLVMNGRSVAVGDGSLLYPLILDLAGARRGDIQPQSYFAKDREHPIFP